MYLGLVTATYVASLDRGLLWNGTLERRLWLGEAVALGGIVVAVGWGWVRARRARSAVARLVVELAQSPPPGGLRDALAAIVGDPELVLAYPLEGSSDLVDVQGRGVVISADKERTSLVGDGRPLAVLAHRPRLLSDEQLARAVADGARLALENERLPAQVRARLEGLARSRARIVEAGDSERRRLERDLHDSAQQRLVGLSLSLRLVRSTLSADADVAAQAQLEGAEADLRRAITELRELAHGIFPAVLADGGLAPALGALAEDSPVPIRIGGIVDQRYPPAVETAAYAIVAEASRRASSGIAVRAEQHGAVLAIEVEARELDQPFEVAELEDRVAAIDGRLAVEHRNGTVTIRAELPCES